MISAGRDEGCDFGAKRCKEGAVCVGFREMKRGQAARGQCMRATTRYVPSYSTSFGCKVTTFPITCK